VEQGIKDREFMEVFGSERRISPKDDDPCLYKASSSVLLTLVFPEEQVSREEELSLLSNPEALWNVLVINAPWGLALGANYEPAKFMTPVCQFIRGIYSCLKLNHGNVAAIFRELRAQLRASESDALFDDEAFSKSKLYHWMIKTCHDVSGSIDATLKFIRRFQSEELDALRAVAHPYEISGLACWVSRLRDETAELDALLSEVHGFKEQVRELVSGALDSPSECSIIFISVRFQFQLLSMLKC
jgi:hypothetical protein